MDGDTDLELQRGTAIAGSHSGRMMLETLGKRI